MKLVTIQQWIHDRVLELDLAPDTLRSQWAAAKSRRLLMSTLEGFDIDAERLPADLGARQMHEAIDELSKRLLEVS